MNLEYISFLLKQELNKHPMQRHGITMVINNNEVYWKYLNYKLSNDEFNTLFNYL